MVYIIGRPVPFGMGSLFLFKNMFGIQLSKKYLKNVEPDFFILRLMFRKRNKRGGCEI